MIIEQQRQVLANLLLKPEIAAYVELDDSWFIDQVDRQIVSVIANSPGISSHTEIERAVRNIDPFSPVSEDLLFNIASDGEYLDTLAKTETLIESIKIAHFEDQLTRATRRYTENPTAANFGKMKEAIDSLDEAQRPKDDGRLDSSLDQLTERLNIDVSMGLKSFGMLDMTLGGGLKGGQLITIGARPGVGKTAFGVNLAEKVLERNRSARIDFFVLEMSQRSMVERFITSRTGIKTLNIQHAKKMTTAEEKKQLQETYRQLKSQNIRIYSNSFEVDDIVRTIRRNARENPEYLAIIDYLGLISVSDKRKQAYEKVSEITRKLKMLTNESDIPLVLFSQLNRGIEARQNKRPMLSDLRDSGSIEQDSNVVGFLYAEEQEGQEEITYLDIKKNREGNIGVNKFHFDKAAMRFEERYQ